MATTLAVAPVDRHQQGVPVGREVGGRRIDDVAVPAGHVTRAEIPVDGVEHDGSRAVEVVGASPFLMQ